MKQGPDPSALIAAWDNWQDQKLGSAFHAISAQRDMLAILEEYIAAMKSAARGTSQEHP